MQKRIKVETKKEVLSLINNIAFTCVPAWYGATRRNLKMDLIVPKIREDHAPMPLIIWICGGGYRCVDRAVWIPEMMYFAERGYVVASIEYRTSNDAVFPGALIDVKSAIRYLKAHARDYCIDSEKICIMGESGGGTLASLAGTTGGCREFEQGDFLEYNSNVNAVVDFYGIVDMVHSPFTVNGHDVPKFLLEDFIGTDYSEEMAQKASAVTYINASTPPFLILHGDQDLSVPVIQSKILYEKLEKCGVESDFYIFEQAGHADACFYQDGVKKIIEEYLKKVLIKIP